MDEILQSLNTPISQITALLVILGYYGLCYSVRLAGGKRRTKKQKIKWSWERFWNDLHFRIWIGYALVAAVIAIDLGQWLMPLIGVTVSAETAALLNANLIISLPFIAGLKELVSGVKLLWKVWKYQENLDALGATVDPAATNIIQIASDVREFAAALASSINSLQEDPEAVEGEVLSKAQTKKLADMGAIPYYRVDISTPELAYANLVGKGFNEGFGLQCVAGFKEFMFSLAGRYVAAGGAASGYALKNVREQVCKLGFTWHDGTEGLRDGCWAIWTNGAYGHVAMFYQGKWLGQNQGATDGNVGNEFNLMPLPMQGIAGYFLPNIYATSDITTPISNEVPSKISDIRRGDKVKILKYVDVNGVRLQKLQKTPYAIFQVSPSTRTAVLKSDDGDIYARISFDNIEKVKE